jgi:hypothetical protein
MPSRTSPTLTGAQLAAARKCADPPLEKRAKRHVILKQVRRRT